MNFYLKRTELGTFEWWISGIMLVLLLLLISRLINRSGLRISHSKVFSSGQISFYLCVISSDPPCKDGNDWFTTEPLKLFSVKKIGRLNCIEFLPITCCLTGLTNLIFIKVQRIRMYQFQMNNKTTLCTDVYMYVPSLTFYTHSVSTKNIVFFMMPLWYVCMIYFLIMGGFL